MSFRENFQQNHEDPNYIETDKLRFPRHPLQNKSLQSPYIYIWYLTFTINHLFEAQFNLVLSGITLPLLIYNHSRQKQKSG